MQTANLTTVSIENINDGAMIDGFELELRKVLANIADLNTPATAPRAVTLQLVLKPHSDRVAIDTEFKCSSKLAPIETHRSKVFLGKTEDGGLVAYGSDPRQMPLWAPPKPADTPNTIEFRQNSQQQ
jgi:hypothetical protein